MKRILTLSMCALMAIALALPAIAARPAVPEGPIKMALTKTKNVTFNHDTHTTVDCAVCHHEVDGAENYQKCSDAGCHDVLGAKNQKSVNSYYRIAHDRKLDNSCLGCHIAVAKEKPELKKALTSCAKSSCHP